MATTPTATPPEPRHALGLPAGSVRALLALGVLGYLWALLFVITRGDASLGASLNEEVAHNLRAQRDLAFVYFNIIMVLILAHFFAAHGSTIGHTVSKRSPLGLPAGSIRLILLGGYLGLAYYLYVTKPKFDIANTGPLVLLITVLLSCFVVGYVVTLVVRALSPGGVPAWFQDVQAWVALLGLVVLCILVLMRIVINPSMEGGKQVDLDNVEVALAGLVGLYFGARS
jgi:hypothetical protein